MLNGTGLASLNIPMDAMPCDGPCVHRFISFRWRHYQLFGTHQPIEERVARTEALELWN